ncbi:helix-turn-helix domain-containing protein [Niveispirillum sp. KHB5.9]|uniref:helix-turn-helix domain-containing protein n=1 Tax=Niveispirillum sp. KHB5.9 TaxID=3400269 RepID=UPI003A8483B0
MNLKTHIGLKVKFARQRQGLTQEQLAELIDKAVETISNIERGHALTGLDTLEKIAGVVGEPLVYFFTDTGDARPVSRRRLDAEEKVRSLSRTLDDDALVLAASLLTCLADHEREND